MKTICLHDKKNIEKYLRKNTYLNIYSIGDLDDFFWPYTIWYASENDAGIEEIALLYTAQSQPTLVAITEKPDQMCSLLRSIYHLLPAQFYAHLSPEIVSVLSKNYHLESHGEHLKMGLLHTAVVNDYDCTNTFALGTVDKDEIIEFYKESYPVNWFDPRMLETNQYFGIRDGGRLVSVAGIHVYSAEYKVAALGNIATAISHRNKGYATQVVAKTCKSLLATVKHIGLNVKADNLAAISCYRKLGFETVAKYGEYMVKRKR
jgi:ribosomal protein S18 acetylase RimI-like enzyme